MKLPQPKLLDFSKLCDTDDVMIIIKNTTYRFASDTEPSGDNLSEPIFGSDVFINDNLFSSTNFGLPFMRFSQGSSPKITYRNDTKFTFNIHYHGLNTVGSIDGASMGSVFGHSTVLGPQVTFDFPPITNNQSLLWFHSHNMFISMELIYGGAVGLLQIVDESTKWMTEYFKYQDNQILLIASDIDFTQTGKQSSVNLVTDENRSNFTIINGVSAVNWCSSDKTPYVETLSHETTKNLVKIDILNASLNWRVFHLGVCDEDMQIKTFNLVQTDTGLMNPTELKMTTVPIGSRVGIIIDLNDFKNRIANLCFYNYDLTEVFNSSNTFSDQHNNPSLTGTIPVIDQKTCTVTPYPTPIPRLTNEHGTSQLHYPISSSLPQTDQVLENGNIIVPQAFNIKPFLKIINASYGSLLCNSAFEFCNRTLLRSPCTSSIDYTMFDIVRRIREIIFEKNEYNVWKHVLDKPLFEYDDKINYISLLNPKYYFNIPQTNTSVPRRNFLLFSEDNTNAIDSGNVDGTTEFIDGANRIMCDLWNSDELDLNYALSRYTTDQSYKPDNPPSSKFKITATDDSYSNVAMVSNDTLVVEFFSNLPGIAYGDSTTCPLSSVEVVFPPTTANLNLQEWIDLINTTFKNTSVDPNLAECTNLGQILSCDWSFFPYEYQFMNHRKLFLKSAVIKTKNNSSYCVRLLGRWPLLHFFGKPMTGSTLDKTADMLTQLRTKENFRRKHHSAPKNNNVIDTHRKNMLLPNQNHNKHIKCDEVGIFGIHDSEIQAIFPYYATNDKNTNLPIACMKRSAELIIQPKETYVGLYDGYLNDNLNSFSVKLGSSEKWIYNNGDKVDSHPFHFHLTSGFVSCSSPENSEGLISTSRSHNPLTYPRDIYQIGPQQTIAFYLSWPYYSSDEKSSSPNVQGMGGVIHCHYLQHNDSNSMIIQYYVDPVTPGHLSKTANKSSQKLIKVQSPCCHTK